MAHKTSQTEITQAIVWLPVDMSWEDFVIFTDKNFMG